MSDGLQQPHEHTLFRVYPQLLRKGKARFCGISRNIHNCRIYLPQQQYCHTICEYAMPALFILIGFMFLFHQGKAMNFIFIVSGILTILEGGVLLVNALSED